MQTRPHANIYQLGQPPSGSILPGPNVQVPSAASTMASLTAVGSNRFGLPCLHYKTEYDDTSCGQQAHASFVI